MNFKILTLTAIAASHMFAFSSQAQAMGLLIALNNDNVKIVAGAQGIEVTPTQKDDAEEVKVATLSTVEPAAGE